MCGDAPKWTILLGCALLYMLTWVSACLELCTCARAHPPSQAKLDDLLGTKWLMKEQACASCPRCMDERAAAHSAMLPLCAAASALPTRSLRAARVRACTNSTNPYVHRSAGIDRRARQRREQTVSRPRCVLQAASRACTAHVHPSPTPALFSRRPCVKLPQRPPPAGVGWGLRQSVSRAVASECDASIFRCAEAARHCDGADGGSKNCLLR